MKVVLYNKYDFGVKVMPIVGCFSQCAGFNEGQRNCTVNCNTLQCSEHRTVESSVFHSLDSALQWILPWS